MVAQFWVKPGQTSSIWPKLRIHSHFSEISSLDFANGPIRKVRMLKVIFDNIFEIFYIYDPEEPLGHIFIHTLMIRFRSLPQMDTINP